MKVRTRFVSNSSTSSFCMYGVELSEEEYNTALEKLEKSGVEWKELDLDEQFLPEWYDEQVLIGREWSSVRDDETGAQFKQKIQESLEKFLDRPVPNCGTLSEAWYNG